MRTAILAAILLSSTPALAQPDDELELEPEPAPDPVDAEPVADPEPAPAGIAGAGDFGLGGDGTLSGLVGVHGRYQVNDDLGLEAVLAVDFYTAEGYADAFGLGAAAQWRLRTWSSGVIAAAGGLDIVSATLTAPAMIDATV